MFEESLSAPSSSASISSSCQINLDLYETWNLYSRGFLYLCQIILDVLQHVIWICKTWQYVTHAVVSYLTLCDTWNYKWNIWNICHGVTHDIRNERWQFVHLKYKWKMKMHPSWHIIQDLFSQFVLRCYTIWCDTWHCVIFDMVWHMTLQMKDDNVPSWL